jgi:predicted DsbA family dithiol-disulfide isomerase
MDTVRITHLSDVLCIWAYVSQIRCDELTAQLPGRVSLDYRYFQVFGDVRAKIDKGWKDRGGLEGYAAHVREVAAGFDHVAVHPEVWTAATPTSSMPAHLFLCAVRILEESGDAESGALSDAAWCARRAFFEDCRDIGSRAVLLSIAEKIEIDAEKIQRLIDDGTAHAALTSDFELAREHNVHASPTLILNEGRQQLTGNVGYRVIEANVRELLERPEEAHSWC